MLVSEVESYGSVRVRDYVCSARPSDPVFAEHHATFSLSYVRKGSFGCFAHQKPHELVPGSFFVGHPGDEFTCSHEHHAGGDECLSFQFAPDVIDDFSGPPEDWRVVALPPSADLSVLGELAQAVVQGSSDLGLDELALGLAERFVRTLRGKSPAEWRPSASDRRRAVHAALFLDEQGATSVSLDRVAAEVQLSPFHFLRVFRRVLGVTPHQHLVRTRVLRACQLLAGGDQSVTEVALEVGFDDLSNFIRTFKRFTGESPRAFRRTSRGDRKSKIFQVRGHRPGS